MPITKYHTVGAVAPDARSARDLGGRLGRLVEPSSVVVLARRGDERLAKNLIPDAEVRRVEGGLSRRQWFEFASTFFSASTVSFLLGVVHMWTGIVTQAILTLASIIGIILYSRRPRLEKQLLRLGLPDRLAGEWAEVFPHGFALVLATVPEELSEEVQEAFLADGGLVSPLAMDRRPVF